MTIKAVLLAVATAVAVVVAMMLGQRPPDKAPTDVAQPPPMVERPPGGAESPAPPPATAQQPPGDVAPAPAPPAAVPGDEPAVAKLRARGLAIPVESVTVSTLVDTYRQPRGEAAERVHEALDIPSPRGTPVLAVEDGRIAKLFLSAPGGITVYEFDRASEFAYYYAHLDRYADGLQEGAEVRRGQVIGYVGSTGNAASDAPHLHFAVFRLGPERQWWRGTPVNPYDIWKAVTPASRQTR